MSARLAPALLDAARAPLARLIVRDWILQGTQKLDGLLFIKARAPHGFAAHLLPWLDAAREVQENDDYLLLHFGAPVEADCASLGAFLPVQRQGGVLATARIEFPDHQTQTAFRDDLILVHRGERVTVPLSSFRRIDIAGLWDFKAVTPVQTIAVPLIEIVHRPPPELKTVTPVPFDEKDLAAGFKALRDRLDAAPEPKWSSGLLAPGSMLHQAARIFVLLTMLAAVVLILQALWQMDWSSPQAVPQPPRPEATPAATGDQSWLGGVFIAALVGVIIALITGVRSGYRPVAGSSESAPARAGWIRLFFRRIAERFKRPPPSIDGRTTAKTTTETTPSEPKPPGLLRKMMGWLVWNTPLRRDLERQYALRLREVDRLFREGRIEEALKRALSLAADNDLQDLRKLLDLYGDMPLSGPEIRERLELDFSGVTKARGGGMSEDGYRHFTDLYREQAKALIRAGDFESAVFIYAELLNDVQAAVDLLIRNERFEMAARLAQARRLPPGLFIPLWFRAGDKTRALALAARHNAFGELLKEAASDDPFRAEISVAWAKRLAATGHFEQALSLTAKYPKGIEDERSDWLKQACTDALRGEPLARALTVLPWQTGDREGPYADFMALLEAGPQLAPERIILAETLASPVLEAESMHPDFIRKLPLLAHHLARRLAADEAVLGHDSFRATAAQLISQRGGQFALRTDLKRLAKVPKPHKAVPKTFLELAPSPPLAAIVDATIVPGERLLVLYRSGLAKLTRFDGKVLWQLQLHGARDIVPIGDGSMVFLVRDELGERRLSLLDTRRQHHCELGLFPVEFHHPRAGADGWLVFADRRMMSLDVPSLLERAKNPDAEIEQHWSVVMGEPGEPLLFIDKPGEIHFAYKRDDGLIEWWWMDRKTLRVSCRFWSNPPWLGEANDIVASIFGPPAIGETGNLSLWTEQSPCPPVNRVTLTREQELAQCERLLGERREIVDLEAMAAPLAPKWRASRSEDGVEWVCGTTPPAPDYRILFNGAENVHATLRPDARTIVVFDDLGRLVALDLIERRVLMRMT